MFIHNCSKLIKILKAFLPFLGLLFVFVVFHYTNLFIVKYYPVCMNFVFFLIFFTSIFREETVIQKIAKTMNPDLSELELKYTRNLTYIWAVFCFLNFLISLFTVFCSEFVWVIYNGCISYIMVGFMFGIEYIVRIRFRKKHGF